MRKIMFIVVVFFCNLCFGQTIHIENKSSIPDVLYYKDSYDHTIILTNESSSELKLYDVELALPVNTKLVYSDCVNLLDLHQINLPENQSCKVTILLDTSVFNKHVSAKLQIVGRTNHEVIKSNELPINYLIAPHSLWVSTLPDQTGVAGVSFVLPLKKYIANYDENEKAGYPVSVNIKSNNPNSLAYDGETVSLNGVPETGGIYYYTLSAKNAISETAEVTFRVNILNDQSKKPVLKEPSSMPTAGFDKLYNYDLNQLVVSGGPDLNFIIDKSHNWSRWFEIKNNHLIGIPNKNEAGTMSSALIFAHSNLGGYSVPVKISVPVAIDSTKQPVIDSFEFDISADSFLNFDLRDKVKVEGSRTNDNSLIFRINRTTPHISWLSMDKTIMIGRVPSDAVDKQFIITVEAETQQGGISESQDIVMKVRKNPYMIPKFLQGNKPFPRIYPGSSFTFDFQKADMVWPSYYMAPYQIRFKEGTAHPAWVDLNDNKLIITDVPNDALKTNPNLICLIIHNEPGGDSKPTEFILNVRELDESLPDDDEPITAKFTGEPCYSTTLDIKSKKASK